MKKSKTTTVNLKTGEIAKTRQKLQTQQGDLCALCFVSFTEQEAGTNKYSPTLDHCHKHGYVREVLCRNCNGVEGRVLKWATACKRGGTAVEWLERVVDYWKKHEDPQTVYLHPLHKTPDQKRLARNKRRRKTRKRTTKTRRRAK